MKGMLSIFLFNFFSFFILPMKQKEGRGAGQEEEQGRQTGVKGEKKKRLRRPSGRPEDRDSTRREGVVCDGNKQCTLTKWQAEVLAAQAGSRGNSPADWNQDCWQSG